MELSQDASVQYDSKIERQMKSEASRTEVTIEGPLVFDPDDKDNPRTWAIKKKLLIAFFCILAAFVANIGCAIYVASIVGIQKQFHISATLAISPISFYSWGLGFGALIGSAACEIWGRVIVYRVTLPLCLVFTIMGGVSKNFATVAVSRTLSGLLAGPSFGVGVGVLNDLWDLSLEKTGTACAVLYGSLIMWGSQTSPMISAAVVSEHDWRWSFWVSTILAIVTVYCLIIPETFHVEIIRRRAKKLGQPLPDRGSLLKLFLVAAGRPFHMLIVEPIVFPSGLVMAVNQSIIFAFYVAYAELFETVYGFTQYQVGMAFGPVVVGGVLRLPFMAVFDKLTYQKAREEALRLGKTVQPELRLYPTMVCVFITPISLFWLAWSGRKSVHWVVPVISGIPFGLAYMINMMCTPIYNNDIYTRHYGASVMAATTFLRFLISASFPLFTLQIIHNLGFAWATSLLAFIAVAMIPIPWVFYKWGPKLRARSRYLRD